MLKKYTDFLGMDFMKIEPGSFIMGNLQESIFWVIPDRNIHGFDLFWDKESNAVYHFSGVSAAENDGFEVMGYCALIQARNGIIHLISSRQHYQFNYQWLVEYKKG